jgi:hypothetical protein
MDWSKLYQRGPPEHRQAQTTEIAMSIGFVAQVESGTRWPQPQPQTKPCHGEHGHRGRAPELREAVEQRHTHMQLHHLTLKRARYDPLAQALEAMHLGLHQASSVVTAPLLADGVSQPDRQRPPGFERGVVRVPVGGLAARLGAPWVRSCHEATSPGSLLCATKPIQSQAILIDNAINTSIAGATNCASCLGSCSATPHSEERLHQQIVEEPLFAVARSGPPPSSNGFWPKPIGCRKAASYRYPVDAEAGEAPYSSSPPNRARTAQFTRRLCGIIYRSLHRRPSGVDCLAACEKANLLHGQHA